MANLWDVRLWKPISIQETRNYDYAVSAMAKNTFAMDMVEEEAINDEAGELSLGEMKISLDVDVSYQIK